MRFFVRFLAELGAPWSSELLDTLSKKVNIERNLGGVEEFWTLLQFCILERMKIV